MSKDTWKINMLKHIKNILGEQLEILEEYDCSMDIDTFSDMRSDINDILNEVIEELKK